MSLPPDWQPRMVEMIRGAVDADAAWFAGGPTLTPDEQIAIYQEQYRFRMWDALIEDTQGLLHLLADDAHAVLWAYLDDNPPDSWTLSRLGTRLAGWLEARVGTEVAGVAIRQEHVEMARLDAAVQEGFVAADGRTPTPEEIAAALTGGTLRLRLQPHVRLVRLSTNVHLVRSALLGDADPPTVIPDRVHLVLFRVDRGMRHVVLDPGAYVILERIGAGDGLEAALEAAVRAEGAEAVIAGLQRWFERFAEHGLLATG